jgi:SAM-dependent methyltransferase
MSYQNLIPAPAHNGVDAYVQKWIAATNGRLYVPLINKLSRYPIPKWPANGASPASNLLLDVGCGWGRWMISAAHAGYRPVGIDVKLDALQAARRVMRAHSVDGFVVVADLAALPFRDGAFDCVFSYSVVQHVHKLRAAKFVAEVARVLKQNGSALVEFPLSHGLTNFRHRLTDRDENDPDSWCVRYYRWQELKALFGTFFGSVRLTADCFCGIGVRGEDIGLIPWKYKPVVVVSEILKLIVRVFPTFARLSDSVFVSSRKLNVDGQSTQQETA